MKPDKVIYTDGHDVVVTDSTLKIKSNSYLLDGITKASFWTIRPDRWPAILLMLLGFVVAGCGYMGLIPLDWSIRTDAGFIGGNTVALWGGIALFILGILVIAFTHEKYAVRIGTAEGEKNALVSGKREYVVQIVDAIHTAFDMGRSNNPPVHHY